MGTVLWFLRTLLLFIEVYSVFSLDNLDLLNQPSHMGIVALNIQLLIVWCGWGDFVLLYSCDASKFFVCLLLV